jgi:putative glutamine amidotransferase
MKKLRRYLLLIISCVCVTFYAGNKPLKNINQQKTRIAIVSPDVSTLKSLNLMLAKKIIDIPDLEINLICYAGDKYRYDNLKTFLKENDYPYITLQKIDGDLNKDNIFQENLCSKEFYRIFKNTDGILFSGGDDIPPSVYGEKSSLLANFGNPNRHYFDLSFLFHLLGGSQNEDFDPYMEENPDYLVYGFCLGMQSMNVGAGGTLYQDIPFEIYGLEYIEDVLEQEHDNRHVNYQAKFSTEEPLSFSHFHRIRFVENRFFTDNLKMKMNYFPYVVSSHHQALKKLGKGIVVAATSMDGKIILAITHQDYKNILGVQFHPESASIYFPRRKKYKAVPIDSVHFSSFEFLQNNNSLWFHRKYWEYFSELFTNSQQLVD